MPFTECMSYPYNLRYFRDKLPKPINIGAYLGYRWCIFMFSWLITCVNTLTELGHFCSNICDLETRDSGRLSKCVNHSDRVIFGTF